MLTRLRTRATALVLAGATLLGGLAAGATPAAAAGTHYGCSYDLAYHWYQAAGLNFRMQSYSQYVQDATTSWVNLDSPITQLRTTDGRTLRHHNLVFYYQVGSSSARWIDAHRVSFTATPRYRDYRYNGRLSNPRHSGNTYYWYGKRVRIIVNAQGHNFVAPWITVGRPLSSC